MDKLRVGVIGAGSWAFAAHLPALAKRADEIEFVGVCRLEPDALDRVKYQYGFQVASTDYRDVLAAGIDVAIIASPSGLHHEHAVAALHSGAHVLLEKPMTIASEDAWDIVHQADDRQRHLALSFGWNYMEIVATAVAAVQRIGIGRLEHLTIHMSSQTRELLSNTGAYPTASRDSLPQPETWTDPRISGGGYAQAQLSHALALALALIPDDVVGAFALMSHPLDAPVELHDAASLRFSGGGIGTISGGSSHVGASGNKHELEVRAIGSEGQFIVDMLLELVWVYRPDGTDFTADLPLAAGQYDRFGPANGIVDLALGRTTENPASGRLGARTVDALELMYASAHQGRWVDVPGRDV
jgi:predicted dehydrogenase